MEQNNSITLDKKQALKIALLKSRLEKRGQSQPHSALPTRPEGVRIPLSFAQARLWFLDQMEPNSAQYNIFTPLSVKGCLDLVALQTSFDQLRERHHILNTAFKMGENSEPYQVILPHFPLAIKQYDWENLSEEAQETALKSLLKAESQKPFVLESGDLLRVTVVRFSAEKHALLISLHHIIADGWSINILLQELLALYQANCTQTQPALSPLPCQFADFAYWQQKNNKRESLDTQLAYWKDQLAGIPDTSSVPATQIRPNPLPRFGSSVQFEIDPRCTKALKNLSQTHNVTMYMTLMAAFHVLLQRYTQQNDLVVGTPFANRKTKEVETLIGFFVNMLPIRTQLTETSSFLDLLKQVQTTTTAAYTHSELPFSSLVNALQVERTNQQHPIFQVVFVFQNEPPQQVALDGLTFDTLNAEVSVAKFDLTLTLTESDSTLLGSFEYNKALFSPTYMAQMVDGLQTLLEAIVSNPLQEIGRFPLLSKQSEQQLLATQQQDRHLSYAPLWLTPQLIAAQAKRTPYALALQSETDAISYRRLNKRANQLAHHLIETGVMREQVVGLYLSRSIECTIAMLAVWKAGGAFLPLATAHPPERIAYMLQDAGADIVITTSLHKTALPATVREIICLDTDSFDHKCDQTPDIWVSPKNLAYIIYTSGSTGQPKGVQIQHDNLLNLVQAHQHYYQITEKDRSTQLFELSFDPAILELFPYLAAGAQLFIPSDKVRNSAEHFQSWLLKHKLTCCHLPTPLAEQLLTLSWSPSCDLRILTAGGEALHKFADAHHPFDLYNHYGPAENCVMATQGKVPTINERVSLVPTIGDALYNVQVYVLDQHLRPTPTGVEGEIYLGGKNVGRGYQNLPKLSAEKFIPDPFSGQSGARLYRTGDMGRYLENREIEFLGRRDHQVKIRGVRIETDEIATRLNQHTAIAEATVIAYQTHQAELILTAYFVPKPDETVTLEQLHTYLSDYFPTYMVPEAFVELAALPLTVNQKIDHKALPEPRNKHRRETHYAAPEGPLESVLAMIWIDVLDLEQVGRNANFFMLGGHSLLATQIIWHIEEILQVEIPVQMIFSAQTISQLSEALLTHVSQPKQLMRSAELFCDLSSMSDEQALLLLNS